MPLYIYNSLSRKKDPLPDPHEQPEVKMYVCGPTVYDEPHIGHARSAYIFDVVRRYLIYRGYKVTFVRNVTDVDDKIIDKARNEYKDEDLNISFKKVADKYLAAYHEALDSLGIAATKPEVIEPKASEYIDKMVDFIKMLIEKGLAYQAGGDVYFDITKAKNYGKLSGQSLEKMDSGARVAPLENKRNPLDFALWKSAKVGEPSWDSPFGKGRPGWHIECSVMSSDILGGEFDIHGGGLDLIFPHHENEIAQSEGAGNRFAKIWMHHGLLTINGQKMAKSLGNFVTVKDFLKKYGYADLLKLLFLSAHYSHPVDYTGEKIEEARQALERIAILMDKIQNKLSAVSCQLSAKDAVEIEKMKIKFIEAMDDDFNTPQALASVFELVTLTNKNIDSLDFLYQVKDTLKEFFDIFGLSPEAKKSIRNSATITSDVYFIDDEEYVNLKIQEREKARQEKDYALSDKIRKELEKEGIILEDAKDGKTTWRRKL